MRKPEKVTGPENTNYAVHWQTTRVLSGIPELLDALTARAIKSPSYPIKRMI